MTSPIQVNSDDLHAHAAQRRNHAAGFMTGKPPDVPDDPDDPTAGATQDLQDQVDGTRKGMHRRTHAYADATDLVAGNYTSTDQQNGQAIHGVLGGKGDTPIAKGIDAAGFGSIMNAFLSPVATLTGGIGQAWGQITSGLGQGASTIAGQMTNVAGQLGAAAAKSVSVGSTPAVSAGVGGTMGAGGGLSKGQEAAETRPASAMMPPTPPGSEPARGSDYVHTEHQDQDSHTVIPAGMGGMPMGLGAGGGSSPGSVTKPPTFRVVTGPQDDPKTEPIPVITETAMVSLPPTKEA